MDFSVIKSSVPYKAKMHVKLFNFVEIAVIMRGSQVAMIAGDDHGQVATLYSSNCGIAQFCVQRPMKTCASYS